MTMKIKRAAVTSLFFVMSMAVFTVFGAGGDTWRKIDDSALSRRPMQRTRVPDRYSAFSLDKRQMRELLSSAPEEFSGKDGIVIELPMPDGTLARFRVEHSLVVEPGLAAKYPDLGATYSGRGIDDPTATVRLDFLPSGFHAMILSSGGTVMIDPYAKTDADNYVSYMKGDLQRIEEFNCEINESGLDAMLDDTLEKYGNSGRQETAPMVISGTTLRTYRLALAGNFEYCAAASVGGNTVNNCLAAMVLIMNRVNGVYEKDVALRMVMVANNNIIAYAADNTNCPVPTGGTACTAANDPYANGTGDLNTNTGNLNTVIGSTNYDIGHVFTTGSGGVAGLQTPCGANKGRGTTGLPNPTGDPFAIDFVAHEMGHQWGGNHTFNGATSNCSGGNRSAANSFEPGSGITVMAYAGICGGQNLAGNSIDTFHVRSLEEIVAFSQTGNGNTCDVETATGNTPPTAPVIALGTSFNIPRNTPFALTASATDVNNDTLTYDWQEYDTGGATGTTAIPNTDSDGTARPIFRPYLPTASGTRFFPSLPFILNNANVPPSTTSGFLTGELLPAITRTMNFQVIVRDNRANGGGINTATATVNVSGSPIGPFLVTAPNTAVSWAGNSAQNVTWDVAGTTGAPVSAANVKISLSTDGGQTFPTTILASTPNDGTESVTIPNIGTTTARIKVEAVGNIFFDISNVNFTITASAVSIRAPYDYDGDDRTDLSIFRPSTGQWWIQRSSNGSVLAPPFGESTDKIVPADYTGDLKTDIAIWRPSNGAWYVLRSEDFTFYASVFGTNGDIPVPGDYDSDNKADFAVFRPSNNVWFIQKSAGGIDITSFGAAGDKPVVGDYDGDNKTDIAIFRPSNGQWWVQRSTAGIFVAQFGVSTDLPVQGFYTADNKTDVAFWRPSTGQWFVLQSEDFQFYAFPFGANGDLPVPGDYDGDNRFDAAVFRPASGTWFVNQTTSGILIQTFGLSTDRPTPNAYVPTP